MHLPRSTAVAALGWLIPLCLLGVQARPAAGQSARVRVEVEGVSGRTRDNVRSVLAIHAASRAGELSEDRVQRLHERAPAEIRLALQPFGFYRPHIDSELRRDGGRWVARYVIDPGPAIRLARIDLRLTGEGEDEARLRQALARFPLALGDPLRHDLYESGKTNLLARAADGGYLNADFTTSEIRVDLDGYAAEIVLVMETGPRYYFGPVSFEESALDSRILESYITFRTGDPFNMSRLLELQASLSGSPYFSRVEVRPRLDLADGLRVPVEVSLDPRKPQRYEFGIGYGTDTGPRLSLQVEHRRLNRSGHRASGEIKLSLIEQSLTGRYTVPSRFPSTRTLTLFAGLAHLEPEASASDKIVAGTSLGRSRGAWNEVMSLTFEREWFEIGTERGTSNLLLPTASWTRTEADSRIFTGRGYRLRLELEGTHDAIVSDATFLRARSHGKVIFTPAGRLRLIGRYDVGGIFTNDFADLPPTVRFFAGGDQSVRGFAYRSLGPRDQAGNVIGGEMLIVLSAEMELRFLENWGGALFYDTGNALDSPSFSWEQGAGLGLRWRSPIGLIRLDGALAVSRSGPPFRAHITIGPDL